MEPIKRPPNVSMSKTAARRLEARRGYQGTVEDMKDTLRSLGEKVPSGANKEQLQGLLYEIMRGGNALSIDPLPSATAIPKGGE